jgi:hypothetical protein
LRLKARTIRALKFRDEWDTFEQGMVTHVYPTNADVQRENAIARSKLPAPDHEYHTQFAVTSNIESPWTDAEETLYRKWSMSNGPIPQAWQVNLGQL